LPQGYSPPIFKTALVPLNPKVGCEKIQPIDTGKNAIPEKDYLFGSKWHFVPGGGELQPG
jgi:hypothetical protein